MSIEQELTSHSLIHPSLILKYPLKACVHKRERNCALHVDLEISCSFYPEDSPCGPAPWQEDITIIPVKACDKALGVSGRTGTEKYTQIFSEADVLFNRGGLTFPTEKEIEEFTVCPRHSLTYDWAGRKRLICCHPNHTGKRNE